MKHSERKHFMDIRITEITADNSGIVNTIKNIIPTVEIIWQHNNLVCFTAQNPFDGTNGYVVIPQESSLSNTLQYDFPLFRVHGGITFDRKVENVGRIIGWDTCHLGDGMKQEFIPIDLRDNLAFQSLFTGKMWTEREVIEETNMLADQIADYIAQESDNA